MPKLPSASVVVEHAGVGAVGGGGRAATGAAGRQHGHPGGEQARAAGVHRPADQQVARLQGAPPKPRGAALALVAASTGATAVTASASSAGARQRLRPASARHLLLRPPGECEGRWVIAGRTSSVRPVPCGSGAAPPCSPSKTIPQPASEPILNIRSVTQRTAGASHPAQALGMGKRFGYGESAGTRPALALLITWRRNSSAEGSSRRSADQLRHSSRAAPGSVISR